MLFESILKQLELMYVSHDPIRLSENPLNIGTFVQDANISATRLSLAQSHLRIMAIVFGPTS